MCPIRNGKEDMALFHVPYDGPCFGIRGRDLLISSQPKWNSCSANFGEVYLVPFGYIHDSIEAKTLLGGSVSFFPSEVETYYLSEN